MPNDPEPWDDEEGTVKARSEELARFLGDAGVLATPLPVLGADGAEPGVWLGDGDALVVYQIMRWAARQGVFIDREKCGLPLLPRDQDPDRKVRPSEIAFIAAKAGARLADIPGVTRDGRLI